jgi:hypothetical protein
MPRIANCEYLASLILADVDWGYLVALIVISIVSWIVNLIKKRHEAQMPAGGKPVDEDFGSDVPVEVFSPREENVQPPPVVAAMPPTRPVARRSPRGPSPLPSRQTTPHPPSPSRPSGWSLPGERTVEAEVVAPIPMVTGTSLPIARIRESRRPPVSPTTIGSAQRPAASPQLEAVAQLLALSAPHWTSRQLRSAPPAVLRQAFLTLEILSPPIALRQESGWQSPV